SDAKGAIPASLPATEGQRVEIRCQYSTSYTSYTLDWYQELPGKQPLFLMRRYSGGSERKSDNPNNLLYLQMTGLRPEDAAVYHCQRDTVTGRESNHGKGQTHTELEPRRQCPQLQMYLLTMSGDTKGSFLPLPQGLVCLSLMKGAYANRLDFATLTFF
uniref:Ig-like domain-containing protein n=1 Tax=Chrysemys picta bellii TaxID=8478 RepID=A0A8C3HTG9_CHRPI